MIQQSDSFQSLYGHLQTRLAKVQELIRSEFNNTESGLLQTLLTHLAQSPGKMLRPALAICVSHLKGQPCSESWLPIAAGVELLHTASLVHDDIIDSGTMRRGIETVNSKWGVGEATLLGDWLLAKAFQLITGVGNLKIIQESSKLVMELSEGQFLEMQFNQNQNYTEQQYLRMIDLKTASIFRSTCCYAALVTEQYTLSEQEALKEFGSLFGALFQIADDLMDLIKSSGFAGKNTSYDLSNNLKTLPVLRGLDIEKKQGKNILHSALINQDQSFFQNDLTSYLKDCGAIQECFDMASDYQKKAEDILLQFPDSTERHILLTLIRSVKQRLQ